MKTVALLIISNAFMTVAWYGHLKYKKAPLLAAIIVSWGIALFEYVFQVPANRIGSNYFSLTQLKIMQECITLVVFTVFAVLVFREPLRWNNIVSYSLLVGAVGFAFWPR
ncbi:MAG: DMT family protein [Pyrinomonadaceae bacterium]